MRFLRRLGVPLAFLSLFAAFYHFWHPDFKGSLVSDFDVWAFYHTVFYYGGGLKPFLFWQLPLMTPVPEISTYYEPLSHLAFSTLLKNFGEGRMPFHLWALLLHSTNAIFIYLLSKELTGQKLLGIAAAAIFLLYPANVLVISDLARSLEHPMVALWGLASLFFSAKFLKTDNRFWYGLSLIFFFLACFSKVSALNFVPVVIFLDIFLFKKTLSLPPMDRYLPFILGGILFAGIATWMYPWSGIPHQWGGAARGIFPFLRLVEFNTWLIFPFYLSVGEPLTLVLAAPLIILALLLWGDGLVRFLTAWIITAFSLFALANFRPVGELYKYMYISTVPFAILVSYLVLQGVRRVKVLIFHAHGA